MISSAVKLKKRLRIKVIQKIRALSLMRRKRKNLQIFQSIIQSDFYQQASSVLIYVSFKDEVETHGLIRRSLKDGKIVFVPHVEGGQMRICRVRDFKKDLKKGTYGILQPQMQGRKKNGSATADIVFVPGLAFDKTGGRLGRGAGYFDRYLAKTKKSVTIGLAYKEQLVPRVPVEKHDVRLNFIITA